MTRALRIALPVLAILAGCGSASRDPSTGSTARDASGSSQALVTYTKSGGLAGIREQLTVMPSGTATVVEGLPANAKTQTLNLTAGQIADLREALGAADLGTLRSGQSQGCADCFLYGITYAGTSWKGDEATLPTAVRPAIQALDRLVAQAGVDQPLGGK